MQISLEMSIDQAGVGEKYVANYLCTIRFELHWTSWLKHFIGEPNSCIATQPIMIITQQEMTNSHLEQPRGKFPEYKLLHNLPHSTNL